MSKERTNSSAPVGDTKQHIQEVMGRYPTLTTNGFGFGQCFGQQDYAAQFDEHRQAMLSDRACQEFENAIAWLQLCGRTKGVNQQQSSYELKHEAEKWARSYISNGMLIAAAVHLGFKVLPIRPNDDGPNAYINISSKHCPCPVPREVALNGVG